MLPPRAYTFIALNVIRIIGIIALLLVFSSNIVTLVHDVVAVNHFVEAGGNNNNNITIPDGNATNASMSMLDMDYIMGSTVPNQPAGAFWAVLNRLFIIFQTIVLILSELGFPSKFFDRFFPVLGNEFGVGALGVFQMLLGAAILSHHVDSFTLGSAFLLFSVGCINILVGLIFRESAKSKRSFTSWKEHTKSVLPSVGPIKPSAMPSTPTFVSSLYTGGTSFTDKNDIKMNMGFGRQGEKAAASLGFLTQKPLESLPKYSPSQKRGGARLSY